MGGRLKQTYTSDTTANTDVAHYVLRSLTARSCPCYTVMYKAQMAAQWALFLEAVGGEAAAAAAGATVGDGENELLGEDEIRDEDAVAALLDRAERTAEGMSR